MESTSCSVFIPIIVPWKNQKIMENAILNLLSIKDMVFSLKDYGNSVVTFDLVDNIKDAPELEKVYERIYMITLMLQKPFGMICQRELIQK